MLAMLALTAAVNLGPVYAAPAATPAAPAAAAEKLPEDAVLLVLDAFNIVRMLDNKDYAARRDEVARNLIKNLRPFIVPAGSTKVTPVPATKPPVKPPAKPPVKPAEKPKPKPAAAKPKPAAAPPAAAEASKVPQKQRIARKFQAAEEPFKTLQQTNPQEAAKVAELLRASRTALAQKQFDQSETCIDAALRLLGVTPPE